MLDTSVELEQAEDLSQGIRVFHTLRATTVSGLPQLDPALQAVQDTITIAGK